MTEKIAWQNKDIASKVFSEQFGSRYLNLFGHNLGKVVRVFDTNLPAIMANELRLDNLFEFENGHVAIVDYESVYDDSDKIIYAEYHSRIMKRYLDQGVKLADIPDIDIIILYTADVTPDQVNTELAKGAMKLSITPSYFSELPSEEIKKNLESKIKSKTPLTDDEVLQLIVLPLTYKGNEAKQKMAREAAELAVGIEDKKTQTFVLSGLMVFVDKVADRDTKDYIIRSITMTEFGKIYEERAQKAVNVEHARTFVDEINRAAKKLGGSVSAACSFLDHSEQEY